MITYSFTPEFEDLLSSLPKMEGINSAYVYQYQGFWYGPIVLHGLIDCQQHFQAHKNDIFLITAPKSGTTWLKAIVYALINRDIFHPQDPHHHLLTKSPHQFVPFLELKTQCSDYEWASNSSDDSSTRIFGSHIPAVSLPKSITGEGKIVYLCRDIKDTFVSLFHFSNKAIFRISPISLEKAFDLFCKGASTAGLVWDQILGYWKESQERERPHKVLFMRYEEIKDEPLVQLRRLGHFLGKPFSQEEENSGLLDQIIELCSFDTLSKVNKTGYLVGEVKKDIHFRTGVAGDWRNLLTAEMASKLDQITEEKFCGSGLSMT